MKKTILLLSLFGSVAFADICEISITRDACPGKDVESYVKCGGKQSCVQKKKADNFDACKKAGEEECTNTRTDITKAKTITVKFGKDTSTNLCKADRPDFNKCK
jgi:hypothetical protein